ncbi:MAG: TetR/AcrR family transcriptional regulator, partial [Methanobacterium sp.]
FAERSYLGAKTKSIAEEAGFSEMTLFRKFKTKKNLYDMVMKKNQEKFYKEFQSLFGEHQYDDVEEFLKNLIKNLAFLIENNLEYIVVSTHAGPKESTSGDIYNYIIVELGNYMRSQEILKNSTVDFGVFAFNVLTFTYFMISDKKHGKLFNNHEDVVNKFVSYTARCFKH